MQLTSDGEFRLYYDNHGRLDSVNHVQSGALAWTAAVGSYSVPYSEDWQAGLDSGLYSLADRPDLAIPEPRQRADQSHWAGFRRAMLINPSYNAVAATVRAVPGYELLHERLENTALMENVDVSSFALLWDSLIDVYCGAISGSIPDLILAEWNEIIDTSGLSLEFSIKSTDPGKGHLILIPE